jgi:hypothetical protein
MENTREVDVHALKRLDPSRFEKEHQDFVSSIDWQWWDYIESEFKREMQELDVTVDSITFEGLDWGHSDANWSGRINLASLMKRMGLDEQYLPLYLAVEADAAWVDVLFGGSRKNSMDVVIRESTHYVVAQGIFAGLDEDEWDELISDQWREADIQGVAEKFVQEKADELLKRLQTEWDYISSEEYFIEGCEANEVKFEIEGESA